MYRELPCASKMEDKAAFDQVEDRRGMSQQNDFAKNEEIVAKHGDRALALIGDERISLTNEDVRIVYCGNLL